MPAAQAIRDTATASNYDAFQTEHLKFSWTVDPFKREFRGRAVLQMHRSATAESGAPQTLHLDAFHLKILSVSVDSTPVGYEVKPFTSFGDDFAIDVPASAGSQFELTIEYEAGEGKSICWLDPPQTAGKKYPYMFTQGQACLNRTLFPCQDTPSIRSTFEADVTVPEPLRAVMGAKHQTLEPVIENGWSTFRFEMKQSIPSYLVALAVGDIHSATIGPRSKVWTEPQYLEAAQKEFEGVTEQYLATGESLFGPYLWEEYDLLVMPPCFPFGGMENPRLTFVTPCLLAGDHSLCCTVAHEISHSWFGNLATNATWGEFWLNEGFTMYAQRKIVERVHGKSFSNLEAVTGQTAFKQLIQFSGEADPLTRLRVVIEEGVDPDETYNETPYEKGFAFVCYLESLVGDEKEFLQWLKQYVNDFQFQCIYAEDMFGHFFEYFPGLRDAENRPGYEFSRWLNSTGFPPVFPDLSCAQRLTSPANKLAEEWIHGTPITVSDLSDWPTYQNCFLLDILIGASLSSETVTKLDESYHYNALKNAEIRFRWCSLIIKSECSQFYSHLEDFLSIQGKQKYLLVLYKLMMKGSEYFIRAPFINDFRAMKKFALEVFAKTRPAIHQNVVEYIEKILQ